MKKITHYLMSGLIALTMFSGATVAAATLSSVPVYGAADSKDTTPKGEVEKGVIAVGGSGKTKDADAFSNLLKDIVNILLFIIGAIAVIMIIIGGIKYTTSNGDQAQVTSAKNTILYAVIGLVIAIMAFAIVNFVLRSLTPAIP